MHHIFQPIVTIIGSALPVFPPVRQPVGGSVSVNEGSGGGGGAGSPLCDDGVHLCLDPS